MGNYTSQIWRIIYKCIKIKIHYFYSGYPNGLIEGMPGLGVAGTSAIGSSDGGSLIGNAPNDLDVPPPDLPPLPMPRSLK